jgi:hypothetical protein
MRFQWTPIALVVLTSACDRGAAPSTTGRVLTSLRDSVEATDSSVARESPSRTASGNIVRTEMRHVNMHVEPGIVLSINRLRGSVLSTRRGSPPALNDKTSMLIDIASGDIAIDTASLGNLLNRHVFGYKGSPLRNLHISIDGDHMVQTGSLHKVTWLPFRIRATVSLTPSGEIRVHPTAVSLLGVGVMGLSRRLGGLSGLISIDGARGARLDGNDFILDPAAMLPPPRIRGRLTSIALFPGGLRQRFGAVDTLNTQPTRRAGSTAQNYMYFHGGTLRFGKLTMSGTDLEIVDGNPANPFDYSLDRYQEHLVAGHSNTTPVDGLIVVMPDLQELKQPATPSPRR